MPGYGSNDGCGFNRFSKIYKSHPSARNYLRLRRKWPDAEIEISVIGGIEPLLFMEPELRRYGFDPGLIASVMDANPAAIGALSLQLMEKIVEAKSLHRRGLTTLVRRQLAVPDKLTNWLIALMLESLSWNDQLEIPRDLIVLIRERLGGTRTEYRRVEEADRMRENAILIGGQLLAQGIIPSFRMVAERLDVEPSTVSRWFSEGNFMREVEKVVGLFDEKGDLRKSRTK